ncbi:MAG: hypothetical protein WEE03_02560 [Chloroflexota bacterium]
MPLELPKLHRDVGGARNDLVTRAERVTDLRGGELSRYQDLAQAADEIGLIERKGSGHSARCY